MKGGHRGRRGRLARWVLGWTQALALQDSSPHLRGSGFRWSGGSAGTYVVRAGHAVGLVVYDVGRVHEGGESSKQRAKGAH